MANAQRAGNQTVFLTLLGGGVFGNHSRWITDAIEFALGQVEGADLDIAIVSYGRSQSYVWALIEGWELAGG